MLAVSSSIRIRMCMGNGFGGTQNDTGSLEGILLILSRESLALKFSKCLQAKFT